MEQLCFKIHNLVSPNPLFILLVLYWSDDSANSATYEKGARQKSAFLAGASAKGGGWSTPPPRGELNRGSQTRGFQRVPGTLCGALRVSWDPGTLSDPSLSITLFIYLPIYLSANIGKRMDGWT